MKRLSTRDMRSKLSDILGSVHYTKEPVIVERNGKPFAVVVSPEDYEALGRARDYAWSVVDQIRERNAHLNETEVATDVTAEIEAVRQERYERERAS